MTTLPSPNVPDVCVGCGQPQPGLFCAACGEKKPEPADLSLKHLFLHAFETFTQADGKIFRTMRLLVTKPGRLTADYLRGKRKPYIAPLPLFLICNVLFFVLQPLIGWNTLSTPLRLHVNGHPYSRWVRPLVEDRIAATQTTFDAYAVKFDAYVGIEARALTLALVPLFLVPLLLVSIWPHRRVVDHVIFALHFCAWFLLWMLVILGIGRVFVVAMGEVTYRAHWEIVDKAVTIVSTAGQTVYLGRAFRAVYGGGKGGAMVKAGVLACAMVPVVWAYRLFLFFVAFWRT
ncbi:MAG: DUF3667 domain-containing protein [Opitutaceae bacterium]